ncbi:GntR family transcriptional regulator [Kribbella swartbergensis]
MDITVDPVGITPPYEQVRAQIEALIRAGELAKGTRLPTVRQLSLDLGLAVNTVARAYKELEADRLVETRGRNGTFVLASRSTGRRRGHPASRRHPGPNRPPRRPQPPRSHRNPPPSLVTTARPRVLRSHSSSLRSSSRPLRPLPPTPRLTPVFPLPATAGHCGLSPQSTAAPARMSEPERKQ